MGSGPVLWAETPDDEADGKETEAHGAVDESFPARRLRRWINGMFGGEPERKDPPPDQEPND
jgi:hypothetical protein